MSSERTAVLLWDACSAVDPQLAAEIPELKRAVDFRNVLIHGYAIVDHQIVWDIVQAHLPGLRATLERHIALLG